MKTRSSFRSVYEGLGFRTVEVLRDLLESPGAGKQFLGEGEIAGL